jgi:hypothetical protein
MGVVVFFNDSAGELPPVRGGGRAEWDPRFGPFDEFGQLLPSESLPLSVALRERLPANGRFRSVSATRSTSKSKEARLPW